MPCVLHYNNFKIQSVPKNDLLISPDRQAEISFIQTDEFDYLVLMMDHLFLVALCVPKVPDLHDVVVAHCDIAWSQLYEVKHRPSCSEHSENLILSHSFLELDELELKVFSSCNNVAFVLASLQFNDAFDLPFLMDVTVEKQLKLCDVPHRYLSLRVSDCHELLVALAVMLQVKNVGYWRIAKLMEDQVTFFPLEVVIGIPCEKVI